MVAEATEATQTEQQDNVPAPDPAPSPVEAVNEQVTAGAEAAAAEPVADAPKEPDAPRGLADLTDDELAEDSRVKGIIARREQSARDKAAAEAKRTVVSERQQWAQRGEYASELAQAFAVDEQTGAVRHDQKKVDGIVDRLLGAAETSALSNVFTMLDAVVPYRTLSPQVQEQIGAAYNQGSPDWLGVYVEHAAERMVAERLPDLKQSWERDFKQTQQQRETVSRRQDASERRAAASTATAGITGAAGRVYQTQTQVDTAHVNGEITDDEVREMRLSGRYAAMPWR